MRGSVGSCPHNGSWPVVLPSGEIFNFVDLCSGVGIVWFTTTRTRVSDSTAVTFSVKCFNPLKLYPLSANIFRKWFAEYF